MLRRSHVTCVVLKHNNMQSNGKCKNASKLNSLNYFITPLTYLQLFFSNLNKKVFSNKVSVEHRNPPHPYF